MNPTKERESQFIGVEGLSCLQVEGKGREGKGKEDERGWWERKLILGDVGRFSQFGILGVKVKRAYHWKGENSWLVVHPCQVQLSFPYQVQLSFPYFLFLYSFGYRSTDGSSGKKYSMSLRHRHVVFHTFHQLYISVKFETETPFINHIFLWSPRFKCEDPTIMCGGEAWDIATWCWLK